MVLFVELPSELIYAILRYVGPDELSAIERVCRRFHACVAGNDQVHKHVYYRFFDPPAKGMILDWEQEIRDYSRLKSICLSKSPNKITQLPFVHKVVKRILSHSTTINVSTDRDTLIEHRKFRNPRILARLLKPYPRRDAFVCQSWLYERAWHLDPSADDGDREQPNEQSICASCGRSHGESWRRRVTRSQTRNKDKKKAKGAFFLPVRRDQDPEGHARRQMSAELQCLLGVPSLVCPPATSTSERHGEDGDLEYVIDRYSRVANAVVGWRSVGSDGYYWEHDDSDWYDEFYHDFGRFGPYDDFDDEGDDYAGDYTENVFVYAGSDADEPDYESVDDTVEENMEVDEDEEEDEASEDEASEDEASEDEGPIIPPEKSLDMYPLAASKVYDMRENTVATRWGPFQADGSGLVDWERMEALLIVLRYNILVRGMLRFPSFREFFNKPFAGSWPSSYVPLLRSNWSRAMAVAVAASLAAPVQGGGMLTIGAGPAGDESADDEEEELSDEQIRALDKIDPYGISGTWMRIVTFLDYADFFRFNFTGPRCSNKPLKPLDQVEELRLMAMQLYVVGIADPGLDDHPAYPVVHFTGRSFAMDSWNGNVDANVEGTVRTTLEGQVHWTLFSAFHEDAQWRTEGIQIGGHKSGRGVVGTWFESNYSAEGPCGPTAFWKMHERGAVRSLGNGGTSAYLLDNTVPNIRIVINVSHPPQGQTVGPGPSTQDTQTYDDDDDDDDDSMLALENVSISSAEWSAA